MTTALVFVHAPKMTCFSLWTEITLVLACGSKFAWFLCSGKNVLFLVWRSIDPVFVWVVEIDLVFVCGPKMTWFCVEIETVLFFLRVEIDLISVWGIEIDLISVQGSELTCFLCGGRK